MILGMDYSDTKKKSGAFVKVILAGTLIAFCIIMMNQTSGLTDKSQVISKVLCS